MRVFVCGAELGLGFVVAQRLLAEGHKVTMLASSDDLIPNLTKNNMNPVLRRIQDMSVQHQLAKSDAAIDVELPNTFPLRKVHVARLRPSLLRQTFEGSCRPLIVTSGTASLGDTGPVPASESARLRPLSGFAWLPRLEEGILKSSRVRGIVIRPAWEVHGRRLQSSAPKLGYPGWLVALGEAFAPWKIHWIR